MKPARRKLLLGLAAVITLALSAIQFVQDHWPTEASVAQANPVPTPAPSPTTSATAPTAAPQDDAAAETKEASATVDIFAVRTWAPPPPPPPKPAPPPPPQAPPLPFKFLGRINDPEQGNAFLLLLRERVLSVAVGDVIDDTYLVDKYQAGQLHFIYRPMNSRQTLSVGTDP